MLITDHLFIRLIELQDAKLLQTFEYKNKEQLQRWNNLGIMHQQQQKWLQRLTLWQEEFEHGKAARFIFFDRQNTDTILGICSFTNIIYGALYSCYLGFTIDAEQGSPTMLFEALQKTIQYMFRRHNIHRIMANYQPHNTATASLLKSLNFRVEGYAYRYLLTDSDWQDSILSSLINEEWKRYEHV